METIWYTVVYRDLLCDRVVHLSAMTKEEALEKFEKALRFLKSKPLDWSISKIYTPAEMSQLQFFSLILIYQNKLRSDQVLNLTFYNQTETEIDKQTIARNFHNYQNSLEIKPANSSNVEIYTSAEFDGLSPFYLIYECQYGYKYCLIYSVTKEGAKNEFFKRFNRQPLEILNEADFHRCWNQYKLKKASNF